MTEAMRDALELIRILKEQYPDETEDQLISRFHKELEDDQALRRSSAKRAWVRKSPGADDGAGE
jgi:hypothetical protein